LPSKKSTLSGFEIVSGLADGASVMPAKWNRPVFSFRFYEGRISRPPLHISSRAAPQITCYSTADRWLSPREHFLSCPCVARILRQSSRTTSRQSRKITWTLTSCGVDGHAKILAEPGGRSSKAIDAALSVVHFSARPSCVMVDRFAAFFGRTPSRAAVSRFAIPVARDTSRASGRLPPSPLEQHEATRNGSMQQSWRSSFC
jgi:hypothetical protein